MLDLESFAANLKDQDAPNIHVDWKPPAGGNEKLAGILERMKQQKALVVSISPFSVEEGQ